MRPLHLSLLVVLFGTVAAGFADPAPAPAAAGTPPAASNRKAAPVLEKGMTEEQIVSAFGRPQEIKPLKLPNTTLSKAETWVYRRKVSTRQVQVATGTRPIPAFKGGGMGNDAIGTAEEIVYTTKFVTVYSVTSLLMIDGKLQLGRQTTETEERF